jgi:HrpA-like RNA helicase
MKSMGIEDVVRFPYITLPRVKALQSSLHHLCILGALTMKSKLNLDAEDI